MRFKLSKLIRRAQTRHDGQLIDARVAHTVEVKDIFSVVNVCARGCYFEMAVFGEAESALRGEVETMVIRQSASIAFVGINDAEVAVAAEHIGADAVAEIEIGVKTLRERKGEA